MPAIVAIIIAVFWIIILVGCNDNYSSVYQKAKPYLSEKEIRLLEEYYESYSSTGYDETLRATMFVRKLRDKGEPLPEGWSFVEDQEGIFCTVYNVLVEEEKPDRLSVERKENITAKYEKYTGTSVKEACGLTEKDVNPDNAPDPEQDNGSLSDNTISPEDYEILTDTVKDCNIAKVRLINILESGHLTKKDKDAIDKLVLDCKKDKLLEELNK